MAILTGGCACGKVRFEAKGDPDRVGICHCLYCRKYHGALFYAAAIYADNQVEVTGEPQMYDGRCFCPTCGSRVFNRSGDEVELNLGSFDDTNPSSRATSSGRSDESAGCRSFRWSIGTRGTVPARGGASEACLLVQGRLGLEKGSMRISGSKEGLRTSSGGAKPGSSSRKRPSTQPDMRTRSTVATRHQ